MKYSHIVSEFYSRPWAILPDKYAEIKSFIQLKAEGGSVSDEEIRAHFNAAAKPTARTVGSVAVIPIYGAIFPRANMMSSFSGGASIQNLMKSFRQALSDSSVKAIVFDVDSPGGSVDLVDEFATEIYNGGKQKHTVAIANTMAASAAYYLASACKELVVTPSGAVGSIGVFAEHDDFSKALENEGIRVSLIKAGKYKTEGNPYQPLSDEARAAIQSDVDAFYQMFVKSVARGRGVSQESVRNGFGEGRMVMAQEAVKENMADRVESYDQLLSRLGVSANVGTLTTQLSDASHVDLAAKDAPKPDHRHALRERELELYQ